MTRSDVNRMVEDVEECLNQMCALPGITGYRHGCCQVTSYIDFISVNFNVRSTDDVEPLRDCKTQ